MESVDKTLSSTQHLLQAIEQDDSLLDDEYFMRKLEYLRMKHKETSDFLARILQQEECLPPSISTCTCQDRNSHFRDEWSFSGCVSAKLITRTREEHSQTSPTKTTTKTSMDGNTKTTVAASKIEENGEEKKSEADPEESPIQKLRHAAKRHKDKTNREKSSRKKQEFNECPEEKKDHRKNDEKSDLAKEKKEIEGNYEKYGYQVRCQHGRQDDEERYQGNINKKIIIQKKEETRNTRNDELRITKTTMIPRSKSVIEIREPKKSKPPSTSASKRDVVPEPLQNYVPQITVPRPFKVSTRKPILNTYSTKFVEEMVSKKKQEEELENQASKSKPFTAHAVPISTYISTNPRVTDKTYIEDIRKRLTANLRKHFQEEAMIRKSKSLGDISTVARPVPLSTYIPPAQLADYRRSRSASRRSVKLLVDAKSPPLNNEHAARSNISIKVRHILCIQGNREKKHRRSPVPDFQRLHAEMEEKLKNAPHKATTVPVPFNLTNPGEHRHRQCKSSSPPRHRVKYPNKTTKQEIHIRSTHSSKIRMEAIRQREQKRYEERHRSEKFWEERREEMDISRLKLLSSMGSQGNIAEEIERKAAEKRKHIMETTKDYEKYLAEMQQRVIERPLIMEQQLIIAQKQKFERKFVERMAAIEKALPNQRTKTIKERNNSDVSAGTYSVKSKAEQVVDEEDYANADFESDANSEDKSSSSSSSSSTKSSSEGSTKSKTSLSSRSKSSNSSSKGSRDDAIP